MNRLFTLLLLFIISNSLSFSQSNFFEKEYPKIPEDIKYSEIFESKFLNDDEIYLRGYTAFQEASSVSYFYLRIFDKDFNLKHHVYIDTIQSYSTHFYKEKMTRLVNKSDGSLEFLGYRRGYFNDVYYTLKCIDKDMETTYDSTMPVHTYREWISSCLFISDSELVNFGYSLLDSNYHQLFIQKADKYNIPKWTKHFDIIDTNFTGLSDAGAFFDKDSNMIFLFRAQNFSDEYDRRYTYYTRFSPEGELLNVKLIDSLPIKPRKELTYFEVEGQIADDKVLVDKDRIITYNPLSLNSYIFRNWDLDMNILWDKDISFDEFSEVYFRDYAISPFGGYVFSGKARKDTLDYFRPFVVKFDTSANILWQRLIENDIEAHGSGNYISIRPSGKCLMIGRYRKGLGVFAKPDISSFITFTEESLSAGDYNVLTEDMSINPMPVSAYAELEYSLPQPETVTIKLFDDLGAELLIKEFYSEAGKQKYKLDISTLAGGMYICEVRAGKNIYRKKIIKTEK